MPLPTRPSDGPHDEVLDAIRQLPVERLHELLDRMMAVAAEPRCAESQADGVPCASLGGSCETCARFVQFVASVRDGVLGEPR